MIQFLLGNKSRKIGYICIFMKKKQQQNFKIPGTFQKRYIAEGAKYTCRTVSCNHIYHGRAIFRSGFVVRKVG